MLANYAALLLGATMLSAANAFSPSSNRASVPSSSASKTGKNMVATSLPPPTVGSDEDLAWECDENAECVQVPRCDEEQCRTTLDVRIHGEWYDLSGKLRSWSLQAVEIAGNIPDSHGVPLPFFPFSFHAYLETHSRRCSSCETSNGRVEESASGGRPLDRLV